MDRAKAFRLLHSPVLMVLVGLGVRVLYIVFAHTYRFPLYHWYQFEMANLGVSLATGHGFASPFRGNTGPSAWTAPVYPWIVSVAFRIFGLYSAGAAMALLVFNSIFSALTSWTIYGIARRVFNGTVAAWSGWIWALFPGSIYFAAIWIWETSLSTFLLSLLFLLTLKMESDNRWLSWCGYGLLWGFIALVNTSAVAWLPFAGCWLAYQLHCRGKRWLVPAVLSAIVFWATLTPWLIRLYRVFDEPVFIRSDFGVELRAGNNPQAQGLWVANYTCNNLQLFDQYRQMGELAFSTEQGRLAREWIAENPARFLQVTLLRIAYFWSGVPREGTERIANALELAGSLIMFGGLILAIKRRVHAVFLFAALVIFYPLTYYFTFPTARYRHAIEPELIILAVFFVTAMASRLRHESVAPKAENATVAS